MKTMNVKQAFAAGLQTDVKSSSGVDILNRDEILGLIEGFVTTDGVEHVVTGTIIDFTEVPLALIDSNQDNIEVGDKILCTQQTSSIDNGIYQILSIDSGTSAELSRAFEYPIDSHEQYYSSVVVQKGDTKGEIYRLINTSDSDTPYAIVGTDPQNWIKTVNTVTAEDVALDVTGDQTLATTANVQDMFDNYLKTHVVNSVLSANDTTMITYESTTGYPMIELWQGETLVNDSFEIRFNIAFKKFYVVNDTGSDINVTAVIRG